jgi:uncharacterized protein YceK
MSKILVLSVVTLALTGCASILNEKTQNVNVSVSNGAKVEGKVNDQAFKAPGVVTLTRENKAKIFVTNSEKCTSSTVADKTVDPVFFLNLLSGGGLGSTTDYSTEKMWKYSENIVLNCN